MGRVSIDITDAEHGKLKALAARGQSIKHFALAWTIGDRAEGVELSELDELLDKRITRAKAEGTSKRTVRGIFGQARRGVDPSPDA